MQTPAKIVLSLGAVGVAAGSLAPFAESINHTTVALALLLVVLFIATMFGSRYALVASIFAGLGFNFLFLPPYYTFNITQQENWVALTAFLITAVVAGQLSSYARRRADESEVRRVQIETLYRELQEAFEQASEAEALRRSEKLKSSLLDAVTHDLRTPLTSIKASATTLLENKQSKLLDEEGETEFLEIIDEETDRLNEFIEGMVGLARIEADEMHLRKSWSGVAEVVAMAISRAKQQLEPFKVTVDIDESVPEIFVDAASVSEVIYSLLDNAARYSPQGSQIRVTAYESGNAVEIGVEDQGPGIPEEWREKVFEKFVRVHQAQVPSTATGLGLGLAIARGIVESQDGRIRIEDAAEPYVTRIAFTVPVGEHQT